MLPVTCKSCYSNKSLLLHSQKTWRELYWANAFKMDKIKCWRNLNFNLAISGRAKKILHLAPYTKVSTQITNRANTGKFYICLRDHIDKSTWASLLGQRIHTLSCQQCAGSSLEKDLFITTSSLHTCTLYSHWLSNHTSKYVCVFIPNIPIKHTLSQ